MNKLLIKMLLTMTLLFTGSARAAADFNPTDPPEPNQIIKSNVAVIASPEGMGYTSGTGRYLMGTVVTVSTSSAVANWKFTGWLMNGETDSSLTSSSFKYTVGEEDVTFTALYEYVEPTEPDEPDEPVIPPFNPDDPTEPETPVFPDEPDDPGEPDTPIVTPTYTLTIVSDPFGGCSFNLSSGNKYEADTRISLKATGNQGFVFNGWFDEEGELLSAINPFVYTMPEADATVIAKWTFDPDSPADPSGPVQEVLNIPGDANGDNNVTIADVMSAISYTLGVSSSNFNLGLADLNNDGEITILDIMMLIDMVSSY